MILLREKDGLRVGTFVGIGIMLTRGGELRGVYNGTSASVLSLDNLRLVLTE